MDGQKDMQKEKKIVRKMENIEGGIRALVSGSEVTFTSLVTLSLRVFLSGGNVTIFLLISLLQNWDLAVSVFFIPEFGFSALSLRFASWFFLSKVKTRDIKRQKISFYSCQKFRHCFYFSSQNLFILESTIIIVLDN